MHVIQITNADLSFCFAFDTLAATALQDDEFTEKRPLKMPRGDRSGSRYFHDILRCAVRLALIGRLGLTSHAAALW